MTGYTRQSSAQIVTDAICNASDHNNEFDAVQSAMSKTSGHEHDGTTGDGPKLVLSSAFSGVLPLANGGTGYEWAYGSEASLIAALGWSNSVNSIGTASSTAVATGTTQIPFDDTIPQVTEGDQYLQVTTGGVVNSLQLGLVTLYFSSSATGILTVAAFDSSGANAICATAITIGEVNVPYSVSLVLHGTDTDEDRFTIRAGLNGAATITFLGASAARNFGAIAKAAGIAFVTVQILSEQN